MNRPLHTPAAKPPARPKPKGFLLVDALREDASQEASYDTALLGRLLPYLKPHAALVLGSMLLMPIAALASLVQPRLIKAAIDAAILEGSAGALSNVVKLFALAVAIEFVTRFGQTYTIQLAGQRATADLRRDVFRHIQRLSVSYFDRTPVGRVVTRVTNDIDTLTELFASGAVTAVADLLMLAGIVAFMLSIDWELSLVTFVALPPLAFVVNHFRRRARVAFRSIRVHLAQLNAYLAEQVQGIAVVQAYGREEECAAEYRDVNADYRDANYVAIRYDALLYSVVEAVSIACVACVLWYASHRALGLEGGASAAYVGTVVAFYEYIQRFFIPIRDLSTKYTIIQSSLAASERIFGLLDVDELDAEPHDGDLPAPAPSEGDAALALEHVTFAYRRGQPVLKDVTLRVRRGERVALVGATGSGKSTLTSLLLRLHDPESGTVAVNGQDVRAVDRAALRREFGVVPQDVFLFSGTVAENVALGEAPERERVREALVRVGAWPLLEARGGLDARVEERGQNFSAGERQLLAFARALYRDAPFLVLDEATANVDSETEAKLEEAVREVLAGRTALVIAHRLSTIRDADRIVVLHRGQIVEEGDHEALLRNGGVYARLHALQFESA
jgi:ATP-binding cassette subfamily B protein